jgi:hypothetical protein
MTKRTEKAADGVEPDVTTSSEVPQDPEGTPKPGIEKSPAVAGAEQVQAMVDKDHEQGFRGVSADPTPDLHYTVAGVTAGLPTPETDDDHAEWVRQEQRKAQKGQL